MAIDIFEPTPVPPTPTVPTKQPFNWSIVLNVALLIVCVCIVSKMGGCNLPLPNIGPDSGFDVKGLHVLIQYKDADQPTYSPKQLGLKTSVLLREWAQKNCAEDGFRMYAVEEPLDKEKPIWAQLRKAITLEPPSVVWVEGRKLMQAKIEKETGAEELTKAIDKWRGK